MENELATASEGMRSHRTMVGVADAFLVRYLIDSDRRRILAFLADS